MKRAGVVLVIAMMIVVGIGEAQTRVEKAQGQRIDLSDYRGKVPKSVREIKGVDLIFGSVEARATGGPDDFGYVFSDSTEAGGPVYSWIDITGTGTAIAGLGDDQVSGSLPIGFSFPFYGNTFTEFWASSNGWIGLTSTTYSDLSNDCSAFPVPGGSPANLIAPMWDDMNPASGSGDTAYYEYFASCPIGVGECTVITYPDWHHYGDDPAGTWQVVLFGNGDIVMQFADVGTEAGSGATTGIANGDGSTGLVYGCDTAYLQNDLAILFENASDSLSDVAVNKTVAPDYGGVGDTIVFRLAATNYGPQEAPGVVVTDEIPAEVTYVSNTCGASYAGPAAPILTWEVGTLTVGQSAICDVQVTLNSCSVVTNTAEISTTGLYDPSGNNSNDVSFNQTSDQIEDGSFEQGTPNAFWTEYSLNGWDVIWDGSSAHTGDWWAFFGGATVAEDASVEQTVVIPTSAQYLTFWVYVEAHSGNGTNDILVARVDAFDVFRIDDTDTAYDAGWVQESVDISAFADGAAHTIMFYSSIQGAADLMNFFVDDVSLISCTNSVLPTFDLALTKAGVDNGDGTATYTLGVSNLGPDAAAGVSVVDVLPPGVAFLSSDCGAVPDVAPNLVWDVGALAVGASQTCNLNVDVVDPTQTANEAYVIGDGFDPTPSNNAAGFALIQADIDLALTKTGLDNGDGTGVYTVTAINYGPDDATGVVVTDTLPAGVTYVGNDCGAAFAAPTLTWTIGGLLMGADAVCNVDVDIVDPLDTINNASVTGAGSDPNAANNQAAAALAQNQRGIPALSDLGMLLLVVLLATAALVVMRRRV